MGDASKKLVKVDNWGMFFLQRIQQHFSKGEFCDVTLQFSNNETIRAHRLVLDVCSEYFIMLDKQGNISNGCITMPPDMQADVVAPVINFMYTGRLEFRADIQNRLYATAQKMKMAVLTKLLDAQSQQQTHGTKSAAILRPQKKAFPPGTFTNLQGKKISPRIVDPNLPQTLPGRKLPIWTRRNMPAYTGVSMADFDRPIRIVTPAVDEVPRPTRFEWPDDDDENAVSPLRTTFEDISYESKPLMQAKEPFKAATPTPRPPPVAQPQRTVSFEEVMRTGAVTKRIATSPISSDSAKKSKTLDLQAVKEYVQETQVRKNMMKEESDEDVDNDLEDLNNGDDDDDEEFVPPRHATPHKSILKSQSIHDEESSSASAKKVRFSLDPSSLEEKENAAKVSDKLPTRAAANAVIGTTTNVTNHAKIITEVLKKYPHLVKNNKNIRLKIMQRGSSSPIVESPSRAVKSKVSYVVLKSDVVDAKGMTAMGLKQGCLVEQQSSVKMHSKTVSAAENVNGPWLCHSCGTNDDPIIFETYFDYRHHLQDVHNEKIDARICEHCGHRASKRNLLLYHQFTKHGIAPPRNCQFPKCDQCDYVALSESLLIKHRSNHANIKDYVCKVCNTSFKSNGALQGHMQANLHSDPAKKLYECPYCNKQFARNINMKTHLRQCHKEDVRRLGDDDLELDCLGEEMMAEDGEGQVMEVPVIDMMNQNASGMTILAEAPAGVECSSEAEGLSHVASGIATSLGLTDGTQTVILLDDNQEFIIQTTEVVGGEYMNDGEYIMPEMTSGDQMESHEVRSESEQTMEQHYLHGQEEVMMVLTDHCYAEEVVTRDEHIEEDQKNFEIDTTEAIDSSQYNEDINNQEGHDSIEETLASFENDEVPNTNEVFTSKPLPVTVNNAVPQVTNVKTYSPTKKSAPSSTSSEPTKPALVMSDLLDDWDEDVSQENAGHRESKHPSALPTRADISDDIYAMARVQQPLVEQEVQHLAEQEHVSETTEDSFSETVSMENNDQTEVFNGEEYTVNENQRLPPFNELAHPSAIKEVASSQSEPEETEMDEQQQPSDVPEERMELDEMLIKESSNELNLPQMDTEFSQESEQSIMLSNQEKAFETNSDQLLDVAKVENSKELEETGDHLLAEQDIPHNVEGSEMHQDPPPPDHAEENSLLIVDSEPKPPNCVTSNDNPDYVKTPDKISTLYESTEQNSTEINHRIPE